MVDNQNQWEDMDYSESLDGVEYDVPDVDDENFSDQDLQGQEGYDEYEDEYDEDEEPKKSGASPILVLLLVVLLGVGGFLVFNNKQKASQETANKAQSDVVVQQPTDSTTDMGDYFFNEANGGAEEMMSVNFDENGSTNVVTPSAQGDVVATVTETPSENKDLNINGSEENAIMVSYSRPVRLNPFKPTDVIATKTGTIVNDTGFEIVEPPVSSVPDENLTKLLQTQISGILYDEDSPSAIVNLNGSDQFVKIGDNVGGYLIEGISRNQVQISYKNNTYVASVGELFTRGVLENRQAVVNLQNKFAGRNRN